MKAVLGIDAAWTDRQPSGVALIRESQEGCWEYIAADSSYAAFLARAGIRLTDPLVPNPPALLEAARRLSESELAVVAVDIPLEVGPDGAPALTQRRRCADNELTRAFVSRGCGTHSPNANRPGPIAVELMRGFGLRLGVRSADASSPCLIEVYPHTAAMLLLGEPYRVPYKIARAGKYWRKEGLAPEQRRERITLNLRRLVCALQAEVQGIRLIVPGEPLKPREIKHLEDTLDALLAAWVGVKFLRGEAKPYGDQCAAIWVPERSVPQR